MHVAIRAWKTWIFVCLIHNFLIAFLDRYIVPILTVLKTFLSFELNSNFARIQTVAEASMKSKSTWKILDYFFLAKNWLYLYWFYKQVYFLSLVGIYYAK